MELGFLVECQLGDVVRLVQVLLAGHELEGADGGAVRFVDVGCLDFLGDVGLADFVAAVVVPLLDDLLEVFEQVDDEDLPCRRAADQNVSGQRVELHCRDLVLGVYCE